MKTTSEPWRQSHTPTQQSGQTIDENLTAQQLDKICILRRKFSAEAFTCLGHLYPLDSQDSAVGFGQDSPGGSVNFSYAGTRLAESSEAEPNVKETTCMKASQPLSLSGLSDIDAFILRFLKARNFNVSVAESMLRGYLTWRSDYRVDDICKVVRFPWISQLRHLYPHGYHGVDRTGRPVYIERIGQVDITSVLDQVSLRWLISYWVQQYEYLQQVILPSCSIAAGCRIQQNLTILDLSGLSYSRFFSSQFRNTLHYLAKLSQNFYPELLGSMIIVNPPTLFAPLWALLKSLLDQATVSKILVLGATHNQRTWKEELQTIVSQDQLPQFLGGIVPDTSWTSNTLGPWRDPTVLHQLENRYPKIPKDFIYLDISRGDTQSVSVLEELPEWSLDEEVSLASDSFLSDPACSPSCS